MQKYIFLSYVNDLFANVSILWHGVHLLPSAGTELPLCDLSAGEGLVWCMIYSIAEATDGFIAEYKKPWEP